MKKDYNEFKCELLFVVSNIISNSFCFECGNFIKNAECEKCGYFNKNLSRLYDRLNNLLERIKPYMENNCEEIQFILFALKNYGISKIDDIIKIDTEDNIYTFVDNILTKINKNNDFNDEEISKLSILLVNKLINLPSINNYIIINCLNKNNRFSIEVINNVICMFGESIYDASKMSIKCFAHDIDNSFSHNNLIFLSKNTIKTLLDGKIDILYELFHEYVRVMEYYRHMVSLSLTVNDIRQIKESIIYSHNKSFFEKNNLISEIDKEINIMGNAFLIKYLDSINFVTVSFDDIMSSIKEDLEYDLGDNYIVVDDRYVVDNKFIKCVDIEDFNKYPQLSYEYKICDNRVVKKSYNEIYCEYNYIKNLNNNNLNNIYDDIIERIEKNK